jgi:hypothetical protein
LVLVVLVVVQTRAGVRQEAHQHSQPSMPLVAVKAVLIQTTMLRLEVLAAVVVRQTVQQLALLVTLVLTLLLRVMLVGVMQHLLVAHTLLAVVVDQAQ